tara:strand:+ start:127 stop:453 length:327 start_codon:yes stop_codon:yes gene_type:complete
MVKRVDRSADGKYHVAGKKFDMLYGSRAQVWHGTAYKTAGGLKKDNIMMNKYGRVVSKKKHVTAKKEKRLEKAGYKTKKGQFGSFKVSGTGKGSKKSKKGTRKRSRKN